MKKFFSVSGLTVLAILLVLGQTGCKTVPLTNRSQLNFISADEEMKLGLTSFEELKKEEKISQDPQVNELVQKVGHRIAQAAANDLPEAQWEFVVFESEQANAFCLPGGKVGIYTGILPITLDEAGLATVMGHEVAHAVARHGAERMSEAMIIQGLGTGLQLGVSGLSPTTQALAMTAYGAGTTLGRELPHSRKQESEADHMGLIYMARAGYHPENAVAFWQRFSEYNNASGGGGTPGFLRTHPLDDVRIRQIQQWIPEAMTHFQAQ